MFSQILQLIDQLLGGLQNRFEILAIEFQEEKSRLFELLFWACLALFSAIMGILVGTIALIYLFDPENRGYAAIVFAVVFGMGTAWAFSQIRSRLKSSPPPLLSTIAEIKKDRESMMKYQKPI